jgi:hypothetical protein
VRAPYGKARRESSSRAGHVQSCLNMGGPPSKPKYSSVTDSALVPRGKGEKHPDEGSETVPETECLQAVGGSGSASSFRIPGREAWIGVFGSSIRRSSETAPGLDPGLSEGWELVPG